MKLGLALQPWRQLKSVRTAWPRDIYKYCLFHPRNNLLSAAQHKRREALGVDRAGTDAARPRAAGTALTARSIDAHLSVQSVHALRYNNRMSMSRSGLRTQPRITRSPRGGTRCVTGCVACPRDTFRLCQREGSLVARSWQQRVPYCRQINYQKRKLPTRNLPGNLLT